MGVGEEPKGSKEYVAGRGYRSFPASCLHLSGHGGGSNNAQGGKVPT